MRASCLSAGYRIFTTRLAMVDEYFHPDCRVLSGAMNFLAAILAADRSNVFALEAHVSVVMAHISVEAFVSEMTINLQETQTGNSNWIGAGHILEQLEASRVQLPEKVRIAHQLLFGSPIGAGTEPFQSFAMLVKLRNELVHPKHQKTPKWFDYFEQNSLITAPASQYFNTLPWYEQFRNQRCAKWSCRAARGIVSHFIQKLGTGDSNYQLWQKLFVDDRID